MSFTPALPSKSELLDVNIFPGPEATPEGIQREMEYVNRQLETLARFSDEDVQGAMATKLHERSAELAERLGRVELGKTETSRYRSAQEAVVRALKIVSQHKPDFDLSREMLQALLPLAQTRICEASKLTAEENQVKELIWELEAITMSDVDVPYVLDKLGAKPVERTSG